MKKVLMAIFVISLMFSIYTSQVVAKDLGPINKIGKSCPQSYEMDGDSCKPQKGAKEAVPLEGEYCPQGFFRDGEYCLKLFKQARVIPKTGSRCPEGYVPEGDFYCVGLE